MKKTPAIRGKINLRAMSNIALLVGGILIGMAGSLLIFTATPAPQGRCQPYCTFVFAVDKNFGVEFGSATNTSYYVTLIDPYIAHVDPKIFSLIRQNHLNSTADLNIYLADHPEIQGNLTYVITEEGALFNFNEAFADANYVNSSITGLNASVVCGNDSLVILLRARIMYANQSIYRDISCTPLNGTINLDDPVALINNLNDFFVGQCGNTITYNLVRYIDNGENLGFMICQINGQLFDFAETNFFM